MIFSMGSSGIGGSTGSGCSLEELFSGELLLSEVVVLLIAEELLSGIETLELMLAEELLSVSKTLELLPTVDTPEFDVPELVLFAVLELCVLLTVLELCGEEVLLTSTLITLAPPEVSGVFLHPVRPAHIISDSAAAKNLNLLFIYHYSIIFSSSSMTAPA